MAVSSVWVGEADSPRQMPRRGISGLFLPITGFPFGETLLKDIEVHIPHTKIDALIVRIIVQVRYNPAALYTAAGIRSDCIAVNVIFGLTATRPTAAGLPVDVYPPPV